MKMKINKVQSTMYNVRFKISGTKSQEQISRNFRFGGLGFFLFSFFFFLSSFSLEFARLPDGQGTWNFRFGTSSFALNSNNSSADSSGKKAPAPPVVMAGCAPATAHFDLDINNTKALIQAGGDMWWDFVKGAYEIPKGSGKRPIFAGALWLGGRDVSGQLKVASQTYRDAGNDFWTGPLNTATAEITPETCTLWDKHFLTTRDDVSQFAAWYDAGLQDAVNHTTLQQTGFPGYTPPKSILEWPAHGRNYAPYNEDFYLAPFYDRNSDGVYNPVDGDYPGYDLKGTACTVGKVDKIYGDQNLWWLFNDKGNVHTETGSASIGMEIRAQAFAFATNDEVNDMTFYNYELINRSTYTLTETYFGQWVDSDLGCSTDDYVGCDVQRGLGYDYNGDELDEDCTGELGYGTQPPALGVDFFQGPYQDNDDIDNPLLSSISGTPIKIKKIQYRTNSTTGDSIYFLTYTDHNLISSDDGDISVTGTISDTQSDTLYIKGANAGKYKHMVISKISATEFTIKLRDSIPFSNPDTLPLGGTYNNAGNDPIYLNLVGYAELVDQKGIPYKGIGIGYGDGVRDNERFGMRLFLYYNIGSGPINDPSKGADYYNYLRGYWKDNTRMGYGGNGHLQPTPAFYMFPDNTDPIGWGTSGNPQAPWTEITSGNTPGDRRFVQSAGPFTLSPGSTNNITVGVVFAQATVGGRWASVQQMRKADDKTQALFDNCFKILEGPNSPDVSFRELDRELIIYLSNSPTSNNYNEAFANKDPFLVPPDSVDINLDGTNDYALTSQDKDDYSTYRFQGYQIFQLHDVAVSPADLHDITKAKLIAQCDIKDGVGKIVNYKFDSETGANVPTVEVPVAGGAIADADNKGIKHSFRITSDAFATGDQRLVNHKKVYFMAISYAYNHSPYNEYDPMNPNKLLGQTRPYLASRKASVGAIQVYTAIPHKTQMENWGTIANSQYGDEVELTRIEGQGNGGRPIYMKKESLEEAVANGRALNPVYEKGRAPISVKVVDPLNVPASDFYIKFLDSLTHPMFTDIASISDTKIDSAGYWWFMSEKGKSSEGVYSTQAILVENEQILPQWGLSVTVKQSENPRVSDPATLYGLTALRPDSDEYINDFIEATMTFDDPGKPWLTGVPDAEDSTPQNWVRSGVATKNTIQFADWASLDDGQVYETVLGGTWAPFFLAAVEPHGPVPSTIVHNQNNIKYLQSVDIVFTSDQSKWTRCPVLEMQKDTSLIQHNVYNPNYFGILYKGIPSPSSRPSLSKGFIRNCPSLDKAGKPYDTTGYALHGSIIDTVISTNENDANYISGLGMSWFPGYVVCTETGERLNIAFGEDSWLGAENGRDMKWNPTRNIFQGPFNDVRFGGKHYIIVFRNDVVEDNATGISGMPNPTVPRGRMPAYDSGEFLFKQLSGSKTLTDTGFRNVYRAAMWVGLPLLATGRTLLETDVTVSIKERRAYEGYGTGTYLSKGDALTVGNYYIVDKGPIIHNGRTYTRGQSFIAANTSFKTVDTTAALAMEDIVNNLIETTNLGRPMYTFNTNDYAAVKDSQAVMEDALKLINVVPNPYYAYSEYETDKVDNRIKIINLPRLCNVSIYTTNGTLIRKFTKDDPTITSIEWDLKNQARIPIASGIYIIYVDVPGVGNRTLKWFGIMRPVDLDSF